MSKSRKDNKPCQTEISHSYSLREKVIILSVACAIALTAFIVFIPALKGEFLIWDDNLLVAENRNIQSIDTDFFKWAFTDVAIAAWYPVTVTSLAIDYFFWGKDPFGYHLTNNIFHGLNTFLVFVLVFFLVKLGRSKDEKGITMPLVAASVTAMLFGLHPLRVESVAWTAERKDVLYSFFYILSILSYLKYCSVTVCNKRYYAGSIVFFAMSLMSKSMAVTLPLVLIILDYYPLGRLLPDKGWGEVKKTVIEKIPFICMSLFVSAVALYTHNEKGAVMGMETHPVYMRFFVAMKGYIFYLYKMVIPSGLAPYYPYPREITIPSFEYMGATALFIIITMLSLYLLRKKRLVPALWFYYVVTLLPVIGIAQTGSFSAANRYTYLPSLGPLILVGIAAGDLFIRTYSSSLRIMYVLLLGIITGVLINITLINIPVWKDTVSLWSYQIKLFPDRVPIAYLNRGVVYWERKEFVKAIDDYSKAIEIDPRHAKAYSNRGSAYESMDKLDLAVKDFTKAVEVDPGLSGVYSNRGNVFMKMKRYDDAVRDYDKAIDIDPEYAKAYSNRGVVYSNMGKFDLAVQDYTKAIELDRWSGKAYNNRGFAYESMGRYKEALDDYSKSIELEPDYIRVYNNRGNTYRKTGDFQKAVSDYETALAKDPKNSTAYFYLGLCYKDMGDGKKALASFRRSAELGNKNAVNYLKNITPE
ncbi:MAG: tetratricopeptide repeat protein [Thermodesulfovibrionia bacterium]|nr:tetratricopeptide repeat protein [Thermodesulfovibrionia bacterium]